MTCLESHSQTGTELGSHSLVAVTYNNQQSYRTRGSTPRRPREAAPPPPPPPCQDHLQGRGLTDTEARLGVMPVATLAVEGGGVALLAAVGTAPAGTGLLADGGSEDDLDLLDFLGEVQPCREREGLGPGQNQSITLISKPGAKGPLSERVSYSTC